MDEIKSLKGDVDEYSAAVFYLHHDRQCLGGLALAITMIVLFLGIKVVSPIQQLAARAEEVSLGKNLDMTIDVHPNREIASLSRAVDRLRLSINRFMKR